MKEGERPLIPAAGAIPDAPGTAMPEATSYEDTARRLRIGGGFVEKVPPAAWRYEVSGRQVLTQWFSYRGRDRSRPLIGDRRPPSPLGEIQPDRWLPEYTTELLNLLNVLGRLVLLEPRQADLLERICAGPTISAAAVAEAAATETTPPARSRRRKVAGQGDLLG